MGAKLARWFTGARVQRFTPPREMIVQMSRGVEKQSRKVGTAVSKL